MIAIVGPTASGKTELAVALARAIRGEIISADSRQIYRELSAGTAKPALDGSGRLGGIPYHLVGCADLQDPWDAGRFAQAAGHVAADIAARGRRPIVAGGSGLYIRAFLEGLSALPPRDETLRRRLEEQARAQGRGALHERLARVDPAAAAAIPANNIQRIIRALEVFELTGKPISSHWKKERPAAPSARIFCIDWPAPALRQRIARRAADMWPAMLAEVRGLLRRFTGAEPGFESLGYPQALACARGEMIPEEGLRLLIQSTCAYAKRQRTWFRHQVAATAVAGGPCPDMLRSVLNEL